MTPRTNGPAIALMSTGVLNFIWALGYLIWGALPLIWAGALAATTIGQAANGTTDGPAGAIMVTLGALGPLFQVVVYIATALVAPITLWGGLRLLQLRSRGVVWIGLLVAVGSPIANLLSNGLSLCNVASLGLCVVGFTAGSLLSLPVLPPQQAP